MNPTTVGSIRYDASIDSSQFQRDARSIENAAQDTGTNIERSFESTVRNLQPTFKKMAAFGTAAFAGIAFGVNKTTQAAARAEDIERLFSLTFGETEESARTFVEGFSNEFGRAESNIMQMSTNMGWTLQEGFGIGGDAALDMTADLVKSAEGLALVDDRITDGNQAMDAFNRAMTGSNQQLQQYIPTLNESALEVWAYENGLTESIQALDENTRAQALHGFIVENTTMSVDALSDAEGSYTDNVARNEAAVQELNETIGKAFLPLVTDLLEAITPVVQRIGDWIEENPELIRNIGIAAGAIAGLVGVVGLIGMALPGIISGFKLVAGVVALIASPVGLVIVGIGLLVAAFVWAYQNSETFRDVVNAAFERVKEIVTTVLEDVRNVIDAVVSWATDFWEQWGDFLMERTQIAFDAISQIIGGVLDVIMGLWDTFIGIFTGDWSRAWEGIKGIFSGIWNTVVGIFRGVWNGIRTVATVALSGLFNSIRSTGGRIISWFRALPRRIVGALSGIGLALRQSGINLIRGFLNGIRTMVNAPVQAVRNMASRIRNLLPFSPAKEGPFSGSGWVDKSGEAIAKDLAGGLIAGTRTAVRATEGLVSGISGSISPGMASIDSMDSGGSAGMIENNIGTINIGSEVEGEEWLERLGRNDELLERGLASA